MNYELKEDHISYVNKKILLKKSEKVKLIEIRGEVALVENIKNERYSVTLSKISPCQK